MVCVGKYMRQMEYTMEMAQYLAASLMTGSGHSVRGIAATKVSYATFLLGSG